MDGSAVEAMRDAFAQPQVAGSLVVAPAGWQVVRPKVEVPASVVVHTLQSVVDYLKANRDGLALDKVVVQVVSPSEVAVLGPLETLEQAATGKAEQAYRRARYLQAHAPVPEVPLGRYMPQDEFLTVLQSMFVATDERKQVEALVSKVTDGMVRDVVDDGVAQEVTVKAGARLVGREQVPNPVTLAPYRTFPEVEQPAGPFVLRVRSHRMDEVTTLSLHSADGGQWVVQAMANVAAWLRKAMPDAVVLG